MQLRHDDTSFSLTTLTQTSLTHIFNPQDDYLYFAIRSTAFVELTSVVPRLLDTFVNHCQCPWDSSFFPPPFYELA